MEALGRVAADLDVPSGADLRAFTRELGPLDKALRRLLGRMERLVVLDNRALDAHDESAVRRKAYQSLSLSEGSRASAQA
jgi:hypothetical protein